MANKHTKKALFMSALSILLCLSMLVGSTFAWFTDTASTGVNTIVAGNLDIALYEGTQTVTNGEVTAVNYNNEVSTSTKLFDDSVLWEPGHVEVAYLKLDNIGSLALTYQMKVNVVGEVIGESVLGNEIYLSKVLKYDVVEIGASEFFKNRAAALNGVENAADLATETIKGDMKADDPAKYFAIIVYMPTSTGNDANHKTGTQAPQISLGIDLVATQVEAESDSFDNTYDSNAKDIIAELFPIRSVKPVTKDQNGEVQSVTVTETATVGNEPNKEVLNVVVPAAAIDENAENVEVLVSKADAPSNFSVGSDNEAVVNALDVEVLGLKANNTALVTVKQYVGTGITGFKLYHNTTLMKGKASLAEVTADQDYYYGEDDGYVTFLSSTFSPFVYTHEHNENVLIPGVAATCTAAGMPEGKKCSVCDEVVTAQQEIAVDPTAHGNKQTIPGRAATCTAAGLSDGEKCLDCGVTVQEQVELPIDPNAHQYEGNKCSLCNAEKPITEVKDPAAMKEAFDDPAIKDILVSGGTYNKAISVPEGKNVTFGNVTLDTSADWGIGVSVGKDTTVTLNSGSYTAFEYAQVLNAQATGAKVIVNGGSYEGNYLACVAADAKVTVNGGTFASESLPGTVIVMSTEDGNTAVMTITGGTFYSEAICDNFMKVVITGGTFYLDGISHYPNMITKDDIVIRGGTFSVDPTAYLADGYVATQGADDMWVVSAQ